MGDVQDEQSPLADECRVITRYLSDRFPDARLIHRYIEAHRILLGGPEDPVEIARMVFVHRNPWSLPFLDAASGLLRPHSLLRRKVLLMTALLEAAPEFTDLFVPREMSVPRLLWCMAGYGISSLAKLLVGCFLHPLSTVRR